MATTSKLLRRLRHSSSAAFASLSHPRQFHLIPNPNPNLLSPHIRYAFASSHSRFFSAAAAATSSDDSDSELFADSGAVAQLEAVDFGAAASATEQYMLPIQGLISALDHFHDFTGLPWWIVIASSTVAMRVSLLPLLVVQLRKSKRIMELLPKLPPVMPPPFSGKSYIDSFSLFRKKSKEIGCPSLLWLPAFFAVQMPCFFLWMIVIRRMSLDNHPGFDFGGTLWFQNLTEIPQGVSGPIFPFLIAGLYLTNIRMTLKESAVTKMEGDLELLAKSYKVYLYLMTGPLFCIACSIPKGSLVYWVTNSSLHVIQQLVLKTPSVRAKLGLSDGHEPRETVNSKELGPPDISPLSSSKLKKVDKLTPKDLVNLSIQVLSKGDKEKALPLLKLALEKDPDFVRALIVMGQTLLQKKMIEEATQYFERAITKILSTGYPTEVEDIDNLILASQWTGVSYIRQGKYPEGIVHLERIAQLKEPDEPKSKAHYFDGLIILSSALTNVGRKDEALKHLRLAAAYNPAYKEYLLQCEEDDGFVSDLTTSRRADY